MYFVVGRVSQVCVRFVAFTGIEYSMPGSDVSASLEARVRLGEMCHYITSNRSE